MNSKISGSITYTDNLRATLYSARHQFVLGILAVIMLVYLVLPENTTLWISLILYLLAAMIISLILLMVLYIRVKLEYKKIDKSDHEKIVKVSEKGIEYGTRENLMFFQWGDIRKRIILKDHILLYITTRSALIIPKHFFSSIQEEKEWTKLLKHHLPK